MRESKIKPAGKATLTYENKSFELPVFCGHRGPECRRHPQALRRGRHLHLRSRLHLDRELRKRHHLHRRRQGHPALSRLSDRPAGRAFELPGSLLPAAVRRTAEQGADGEVRPLHHPCTPWCMSSWRQFFSRLPPRRPSDGDHVRRGRRAVGLLSRLHRHQRSAPARDRQPPPDRQDADDRGDGLQIFDRPALRVSAEQARLHREFPAHDASRSRPRSTRSIRCWPRRWTPSSSCMPTTSRMPRPRRCAWPVRRAPIRSPASRPASPACGARRMAAPTKRR